MKVSKHNASCSFEKRYRMTATKSKSKTSIVNPHRHDLRAKEAPGFSRGRNWLYNKNK